MLGTVPDRRNHSVLVGNLNLLYVALPDPLLTPAADVIVLVWESMELIQTPGAFPQVLTGLGNVGPLC